MYSDADAEFHAWMRFVDALYLSENQSKRLLSAWLRLHRAF
jgi:hypothetical protein